MSIASDNPSVQQYKLTVEVVAGDFVSLMVAMDEALLSLTDNILLDEMPARRDDGSTGYSHDCHLVKC